MALAHELARVALELVHVLERRFEGRQRALEEHEVEVRFQQLVQPADVDGRVEEAEGELGDALGHVAPPRRRGEEAEHGLEALGRDVAREDAREGLDGVVDVLGARVAREEARRDLRGPLLELPLGQRLQGLGVARGQRAARGLGRRRVALQRRLHEVEPVEDEGVVPQRAVGQRELRAAPEDLEDELGEDRRVRVRAGRGHEAREHLP